MTIHMLCSECGSALNVRDDLAGTVRHCPKCKVELHIPVPVGGPPASDMESTKCRPQPPVTARRRRP